MLCDLHVEWCLMYVLMFNLLYITLLLFNMFNYMSFTVYQCCIIYIHLECESKFTQVVTPRWCPASLRRVKSSSSRNLYTDIDKMDSWISMNIIFNREKSIERERERENQWEGREEREVDLCNRVPHVMASGRLFSHCCWFFTNSDKDGWILNAAGHMWCVPTAQPQPTEDFAPSTIRSTS